MVEILVVRRSIYPVSTHEGSVIVNEEGSRYRDNNKRKERPCFGGSSSHASQPGAVDGHTRNFTAVGCRGLLTGA